MGKRDEWSRKQTQVVWEDLRPWVEQLYAEFHARVDIEITLVPEDWRIVSAVSVSVYVPHVGDRRDCLWHDWLKLEPTVTGGAESLALRLVSKALLELSADRDRSERQSQLL